MARDHTTKLFKSYIKYINTESSTTEFTDALRIMRPLIDDEIKASLTHLDVNANETLASILDEPIVGSFTKSAKRRQ